MKYRLFLVMATLVVLGNMTTSCSWDDVRVVAPDGDQKTPISFNVNIGSVPAPVVTTRSNNTLGGNVSSTRGYTTGSSNSGYTFSGGEYMTVAVTGQGVTSRPTTEVMKQYTVAAGSSGGNALTYQKDANGTSATSGFDWLSTNETVSIRAWSDGKTTTPATPVVDPDNNTFTIETTQSGDVKELLYSPDTDYDYATYSSTLNIKLYHQLARIVVTATCDDTDFAVTAVNIGDDTDGHRIPITGKFSKPSTGNNYGSWSVESETDEPTHWKAIQAKQETSTTTNVYKYSAVVMPATYAKDFELLYLTADSKTYIYKLPAAVTLSPGKQYNFNILVKNSYITVTTDITDWTDADPSSDFTHGDGLAVQRTIKMNPLWYVAEYNVNYTPASGSSWDGGAGTFSMASASDEGYWFIWTDALKFFTTSANANAESPSEITEYYNPDGCRISGWHLPLCEEFYSIVPAMSRLADGRENILAYDDGTGTFKSSLFTVKFGYNTETKNGISEASYWKKAGSQELHAIRFLGTKYCSAWKYVWTTRLLTISATLIDVVNANATDAANWYNDNFSSVYWGNSDEKGAAQREFRALGSGGGTGVAGQYEDRGYFWSTTLWPAIEGHSCGLWLYFGEIGGSCAANVISNSNTSSFNVRLFRNN